MALVKALDTLVQALKSENLIPEDFDTTVLRNSPDGPLRTLHRIGAIDEKKAAQAVAKSLAIPYIDLDNPAFCVSKNLMGFKDRIDYNFCWRERVIPLVERKGYIAVACANPYHREPLRALEFNFGCPVRESIAEESKILRLLAEYLPPQSAEFSNISYPEVDDDLEFITSADMMAGTDFLRRTEDQRAIVRLCSTIILRATREGASDIHLEPLDHGIDVRYRIDGIMQRIIEVPKRLQNKLIARFKILAGMDISERRRPQDGRIRVRVDLLDVDLRVSTVPASFGEKVVMRILRSDGNDLSFNALGLPESFQLQIKRMLRGNGKLFLTTGPTGSGKTTTLYTCIAYLRDGTKNIETVEDPVEFRISGVNQIQVNESIGVTFASSLRSILRQDPDVIMVGEIRDEETAEIAIQAGQTGHLVLSCLHTNDAPSAIPRLLNLGIEPYSLAAGLSGILAQRLIRCLCDNCKEPHPGPFDDIPPCLAEELKKGNTTIYRAVGCRECSDIGYKGRVGIFSLLEITTQISEIIARNGSLAEIINAAIQDGHIPLEESALRLVISGKSSLNQVRDYLELASPAMLQVINASNEKQSSLSSESQENPSSSSEEEENAENSTTISEQQNKKPASGTKIKKPRVLLIDDEQDLREIFSSLLERNMYEVIQADNGFDGLQKVYESSPDVVLCDLMMPAMSGKEFLIKMRNHPDTKNIPVVIFTAADDEETEVGLLELGAVDFVSKGSSYTVMLSRLRRMIALSGSGNS